VACVVDGAGLDVAGEVEVEGDAIEGLGGALGAAGLYAAELGLTGASFDTVAVGGVGRLAAVGRLAVAGEGRLAAEVVAELVSATAVSGMLPGMLVPGNPGMLVPGIPGMPGKAPGNPGIDGKPGMAGMPNG